MNMRTGRNEQIAQMIIHRDYQFQIGNYFRDGSSIFKMYPKQMIGIVFFTMMALLLLNSAFSLFPPVILNKGRALAEYGGSWIVVVFYYLFRIIAPEVLLQLLLSNLFIVIFKLIQQQPIAPRDFFRIFLSFPIFVRVFFVSLTQSIVILPASLPIILSQITNIFLGEAILLSGVWFLWILPPSFSADELLYILILIAILGFAILLGGIYLFVCYSFALPLVIEKHFTSWLALQTSRKLVTKRCLSVAVFNLMISMLCSFARVFNFAGLQIGLSVILPWSICVIVAAYTDIVGLNGAAQD